ncbi:MAG: alpha-glucosidase/alpha-galactosidase, partial [Acidimicrobiales bacterium]
PIDEIDYRCAGINHMAFYLEFTRDGEDLFPEIERVITEDRIPAWNRVRYEVFRRFGYFVTESSEHFAEYVPWFIKSTHPELLEEFRVPLDEYLRRCEIQITGWDFMRRKLEDPDVDLSHEFAEAMKQAGVLDKHMPHVIHNFENLNDVTRSNEYGSLIIHSLETGQPRTIYGNVRNGSLIDNLPADCCVEVPCLVDENGIEPEPVGTLPPQLAALMRTNIGVQELTVEAILSGEREHVYHAAMLDPHTAAELSLDEIEALVDDLIEAHGEWIPAALR